MAPERPHWYRYSISVKLLTLLPAPLGGYAALAALLLTASCVSTERETTTPSRAPRTEYTPPTGKGQRVSTATVLNAVQATHAFTGPSATDRFVLQLRGPRVLTGKLHLAVLGSRGDTLYREVLPARVLQDPAALTVRDQEISVLRGMNNFFSASRFATPAVLAAAVRPANLSTADWATLRADPQATSFDYPAANGAQHRLVYSPKLGRAVLLAE